LRPINGIEREILTAKSAIPGSDRLYKHIDANHLLKKRLLIYMDDRETQTMKSMIVPAVKSLIQPLDLHHIWKNVWALDEDLAGD
jgi:hypothetical protein